MSPDLAPEGNHARAGGGFTLVEIVVSTAILGLITTAILSGLLYGMTAARRGQTRGVAAAWVQAELDYLRVQGYSFLADDVATGTRTLTQTYGYTAYGDLSEPRIPAQFDRAVVKAEDVPGLPLRMLTVTLYETPDGPPFTILTTYVANFTYAAGP
ncbi:MAG TPA: type II secretion system protein [bacterium]|nr:type II secretion system protein [bacterium]